MVRVALRRRLDCADWAQNAKDALEIRPEAGIAQGAELLVLVLVLVRQLCLELDQALSAFHQ
jgi:hypothetical protein